MVFQLLPNSDLPEWPKPGPEFDKQVAALQKETPYPHCQNSDNISYRRLMVEILFPYYQDLKGAVATIDERTIPYVGCVCPKMLPAQVKVEIVTESWKNKSRYAYINIIPAKP